LYTGELQIVPVKGLPIKTVWRLIWLKGKKHSPVASAFIHHTKNEKSTIVETVFDWYERY